MILRHGAYLCLRPKSGAAPAALARLPIDALAARLGFASEFDRHPQPPERTVAYLRRQAAGGGTITDDGVLRASWLIHVVAPTAEPVAEFCREAEARLAPLADVRRLAGVARKRTFTGAAMEEYAYARAVSQQPGPVMPNGFLIPMSKTAEWWRKDWMERHTYFLPRYDDAGRMVAEGHALTAEAGIPCIVRRTYHAPEQPAPSGAYDFVTYFECADADIPVFERVCANLRDVTRNPEWKFVREGPTWHGRRAPGWPALFSGA
ncbi:MAG: hypothetical protein HY728_10145 [Candidatus Rokubacteria bacterium]|nr:hypothetical protein [Candidatus Rokubacteria bacterium]